MVTLRNTMTISLSFQAAGYRAGTRHRAHSHDELHLSLVLSGRVAETVGSATEYAGALSVVAKDAGVVHANDFGSAGARLARLTLPSGTLGALVDEPSRSPGWRWTHDARVANPFLRLVHRAKGGECAFGATDPDVLDLLAAFTARPAAPVRGRPPAWLEETMLELRSSWRPGISVADVGHRAGVHPVYLARSVRRWYGTGVGEELRRLRIRSAAAAIAESGGTVSNIAHAGGFADEPHLCREFHRTVGITPGRYRALVRNLGYAWRGSL
jgi:AraC family transcriptional regulator